MPTYESMLQVMEVDPWAEPDEEDRQRMQIMTDAGWPGENYDVRQAVRETLRWKCPEELEGWP